MSLFDISNLSNRLKELENETNKTEFWNNNSNSSKILKEITQLKNKIELYKRVNDHLENIIEMNELLQIEKDESLEEELNKTIKQIQKEIEKLEINILLSGKYDSNNAILTLHPGAGGTESCDWVEMLYRMYTRWAVDNNYEIKELDYLEGDEARNKKCYFFN